MKIPETSANIGAYYGNEDNGQWQPNGVIIDNGVGGGVVGSGDAGVHRPPVYPVHIPRGHIPGYVMAGAYYPPPAYPQAQPAPQDDFADYMWMENEEEFDKQVMQQLEEEALMEQCIEAMLEDEQRERHRPVSNGHNNHMPTTSNGQGTLSLEETVSRSTLNPLAAEFVPTRALPPTPTTTPATEEKKEQSTDGQTEDAPSVEVTPQEQVDSKEEVAPSQTGVPTPTPTPSETPEVSAADVEPVAEKQPKETRKTEPKKTPKQEPKVKAKPAVVKSDTKVPLKKKEVKAAKSETRVEEKIEEAVAAVADVAKQSQQPVGEEATGVKPINYAAAARANKPKKPSTPPATDKQQPKEKVEKKEKVPIKEKPKTDKTSIQRKNSMK